LLSGFSKSQKLKDEEELGCCCETETKEVAPLYER